MNLGSPGFGQQNFPPMHPGMMLPQNDGQIIMPGQGQWINQGHHNASVNQYMIRPVLMNTSMMGRPAGAPPTYHQALTQSYQPGTSSNMKRNAGRTEEQIQKEKYFLQQQAKLKHFAKGGRTTMDPNKLIDSIFSSPSAPSVSTDRHPQEHSKQTGSNDDDGFGDFLGSSQSENSFSSPSLNQTQNSMGTSQTVQHSTSCPILQHTASNLGPSQPFPVSVASNQPATIVGASAKVYAKDLSKLMLESCDLNTPQKARLFQKPSLKDINVVQDLLQAQHIHHVSQGSRRWDTSEELSQLFLQEAAKDQTIQPVKPKATKKVTSPSSKHPPKPPLWLTDDTLLPPVYKQVIEASLVNGQISTERLYPILLLSGLQKEVMGNLWSMCNRNTPGQLMATELYQLLALIALVQKNFKFESPDILYRCPQAPVPILSPAGSQSVSTPVVVPLQVLPTVNHTSSLQTLDSDTAALLNLPGQGISMVPGSLQSVTPSPLLVDQGHLVNSNIAHMVYTGGRMQAPKIAFLPLSSTVTSSPATLPVTQLPSAGVPQSVIGQVVTKLDDDDFADFQSSPQVPVIKNSGSLEKNHNSLKDDSKYLSAVSAPGDKVFSNSYALPELNASTVENFFGSDDSSDTTSPDDKYFDGYKSADSKPSDSSQFSTDQSDGEDFKNFENYLDEFQRRKDQRNESPLHRPISKYLNRESPHSTPGALTRQPVKTAIVTKLPLSIKIGQGTSHPMSFNDEFSEFTDFQSAPIINKSESIKQPPVQKDPLKASASAIDLIGDEDKYAALRSLELKSPSSESQNDPLGEVKTIAKDEMNIDDNWADFQAVTEINKNPVDIPVKAPVFMETKAVVPKADNDDDWTIYTETVVNPCKVSAEVDKLGASTSNMKDNGFSVDRNSVGLTQFVVEKQLDERKKHVQDSDDWAEFQSVKDDFSDFQSVLNVPTITNDGISRTELVSVKRDRLDSTEILELFKVKSEPLTNITGRDDDIAAPVKPDISVPVNLNMLNASAQETQSELPTNIGRKLRFSSGEDDFMKPPPLDDGIEEEDISRAFTRGYDLDGIMHSKIAGNTKTYAMYVQKSPKSKCKTDVDSPKDATNLQDIGNTALEINKNFDIDYDSDSMFSKDNIFKDRLRLNEAMVEDSQSIASLDLVVNKNIENVIEADNAEVQSLSSNDFEIGQNKDAFHESKSLDSLDLRTEESCDAGTIQDISDKEFKEEPPQRDIQDDGLKLFEHIQDADLPIFGDRYSVIMHDVPGSDHHAVEWQRCLYRCCKIIQDANSIFNSISCSNVCTEVIRSSQGAQYIAGVIEIYRVVCRITVSKKKYGINSDKLTQFIKDIDIAWNNLAAFLVGGCVMPDEKSLDFSHGTVSSNDIAMQYLTCGVCLLNTEMQWRGLESENNNARLMYGGRQYHAPCANFWINCVDSILPALELPELL